MSTTECFSLEEKYVNVGEVMAGSPLETWGFRGKQRYMKVRETMLYAVDSVQVDFEEKVSDKRMNSNRCLWCSFPSVHRNKS